MVSTISKKKSAHISAKGQFTPGNLLTPEQFVLGGPNFGSAQTIGSILGDYGFGIRAEFQHYLSNNTQYPFGIQPYVFTDYGRAYLKRPTVTEEKFTTVASAGLGLRFNTYPDMNSHRSISIFLEYARQLDGPSDKDNGDKLSLTLVIRF